MSVGWESRRGGSTVARHEWKGLSKMSGKLEDLLQKQRDERRERASRRATTRSQIPGAFEPEESEDDEE
jgi:DDB1- and CUL4-associated factor 11